MSVQARVRNARGEGSRLREGLVDLLPDVDGTDVTGRVPAVWTSLHGLVSLRTGKPGYSWPVLEEHVDLLLREELRGGPS